MVSELDKTLIVKEIQEEDNQQKQNIIDIFDKKFNKGIYQWQVIALLGIAYYFLTFVMITPDLLFKEPQFYCGNNICDFQQYQIYNGEKHIYIQYKSLVVEYQLYGDRKNLAFIGKSLIMLGGFLGTILLMPLSDRIGRVLIIRLCWFIFTISLIIMSFVPNLIAIYIGYFFLGCGMCGMICQIFVYLSEITSGELRSRSVAIAYIMYSLSEISLYPILEIQSNWKIIFRILIIPTVLINLFMLKLIESPLYLSSTNPQKSIVTLNKILKLNKDNQKIYKMEDVIFPKQKEQKYNYLDLFRFKSLRWLTVNITIIKVGLSLTFFGITMSLCTVGHSFEENSFFVGIGDLLGYIIAGKYSSQIKRKIGYQITTVISVIFCCSIGFIDVPENCNMNQQCFQQYLQMFLVMMCRFTLSFVYAILIIWQNELYPTNIRSVGIGFVYSFGIAGGFIIPYIQLFSESYGLNPMLVLGILTGLSTIFTVFLKETQGQGLQQDIIQNSEYDINQKNKKNLKKIIKQKNNNSNDNNFIINVDENDFNESFNSEKETAYSGE